MKKNAMLKIAAILLVAVLLTTCAISATFAKYVSAASFSEVKARVAKWGVNVTATAGDAFAEKYGTDSATLVFSAVEGEDVIAPGTKNDEAIVIELSGDPEVAVDVLANFTLTVNGDWKGSTGAEYFPVKFYVNGTVVPGDTIEAVKTNLAQQVVGAFAATDVAPDRDADTKLDEKVTIGWEWPDLGDDKVDNTVNMNDTALGNATGLQLILEGSVTVVQKTVADGVEAIA